MSSSLLSLSVAVRRTPSRRLLRAHQSFFSSSSSSSFSSFSPNQASPNVSRRKTRQSLMTLNPFQPHKRFLCSASQGESKKEEGEKKVEGKETEVSEEAPNSKNEVIEEAPISKNEVSEEAPNSKNEVSEEAPNSKSSSKEDPKESSSAIRRIEQEDDDYYDDFESSGSKNSWKRYVTYTFTAGLLGLMGWAGFSLFEELFGRGAPSNLFSETFERVRYHDEILLMTGSPMKGYGQDAGRRSEGRRNHVANRKYVGSDGSKRVRIRYTVSGPKGKAIVYAEISDRMESHEFVYLIVKDARTGRVQTLEDNRDMLEEKSRGSTTDSNPLNALLRGVGGGN